MIPQSTILSTNRVPIISALIWGFCTTLSTWMVTVIMIELWTEDLKNCLWGLCLYYICDARYVVTLLDHMLKLHWYMARLVVKNGHQNDRCYDETTLTIPISVWGTNSRNTHYFFWVNSHNWWGLKFLPTNIKFINTCSFYYTLQEN